MVYHADGVVHEWTVIELKLHNPLLLALLYTLASYTRSHNLVSSNKPLEVAWGEPLLCSNPSIDQSRLARVKHASLLQEGRNVHMDLFSTAKLLLKICSSVSPSFQTTESMRWKLVSIICLTKHYQDRCDNWSPLSRWPFLQRFTSRTLKIQIRHNETGWEVEIHFYRPSICPPLINVSAVEIERPHFSVFIRPGWTQSCRPFNVQTHTELIEDKSRLKFRQHGKLSIKDPHRRIASSRHKYVRWESSTQDELESGGRISALYYWMLGQKCRVLEACWSSDMIFTCSQNAQTQ